MKQHCQRPSWYFRVPKRSNHFKAQAPAQEFYEMAGNGELICLLAMHVTISSASWKSESRFLVPRNNFNERSE